MWDSSAVCSAAAPAAPVAGGGGPTAGGGPAVTEAEPSSDRTGERVAAGEAGGNLGTTATALVHLLAASGLAFNVEEEEEEEEDEDEEEEENPAPKETFAAGGALPESSRGILEAGAKGDDLW